MAITYSIPLGVPTLTLAGVAYALPVRACMLISSGASEVSLDGTAWAAHTSGQNAQGAFVRTTGAATVLAKPIG
jgi:hypothetical protein